MVISLPNFQPTINRNSKLFVYKLFKVNILKVVKSDSKKSDSNDGNTKLKSKNRENTATRHTH